MTRMTGRIKTVLLKLFGPRATAMVHALRFAWRIRMGAKEDPEFDIASSILSAGDIAVDVGANSADWTYHLSKAVGAKGCVYAYEADPYYADATLLATKILGLKNVVLFPFGLSDKTSSAALHVVDKSGLRMSGEGFVEPSDTGDGEGLCRIELRMLDSMLSDYPKLKQVSLIKIDVEGFELFVLRGGVDSISQSRPFVILEIGNYERYGYGEEDVYKFFNELNYSAYACISNSKMLVLGATLQHAQAISVNRIFVPNEKLGKVESFLLDTTSKT